MEACTDLPIDLTIDLTTRQTQCVLFDIETNVPANFIIEFGAIIVDKQCWFEHGSYSTLIQPPAGQSVNQTATRIHGITQQMLSSAPTVKQVTKQIYDMLHGRIWMGHNINAFDIPHLKKMFESVQYPFPTCAGVVDTLPLIRQHYGPRAGDCKMASLGRFFGLGEEQHRAVSDCRMTLEVLRNIALTRFLETNATDVFGTHGAQTSVSVTTETEKKEKITRPRKKKEIVNVEIESVTAAVDNLSIINETVKVTTTSGSNVTPKSPIKSPVKSPVLSPKSPIAIPIRSPPLNGTAAPTAMPTAAIPAPAAATISTAASVPVATATATHSAVSTPATAATIAATSSTTTVPINANSTVTSPSSTPAPPAVISSAPAAPLNAASKSSNNPRSIPNNGPASGSTSKPQLQSQSQPQSQSQSKPATKSWATLLNPNAASFVPGSPVVSSQPSSTMKQLPSLSFTTGTQSTSMDGGKKKKKKSKQSKTPKTPNSEQSLSSSVDATSDGWTVVSKTKPTKSKVPASASVSAPASTAALPRSPVSPSIVQQIDELIANPVNIWLTYGGGKYPGDEREIRILEWESKPHRFLAKIIGKNYEPTQYSTNKIIAINQQRTQFKADNHEQKEKISPTPTQSVDM